MKILNNTRDVPSQITYRGHIYKSGTSYGNLEQARREARYFRENGLLIVIKKFYIQPSRPYSLYVLYGRAKK